jgi:hypothetical protein
VILFKIASLAAFSMPATTAEIFNSTGEIDYMAHKISEGQLQPRSEHMRTLLYSLEQLDHVVGGAWSNFSESGTQIKGYGAMWHITPKNKQNRIKKKEEEADNSSIMHMHERIEHTPQDSSKPDVLRDGAEHLHRHGGWERAVLYISKFQEVGFRRCSGRSNHDKMALGYQIATSSKVQKSTRKVQEDALIIECFDQHLYSMLECSGSLDQIVSAAQPASRYDKAEHCVFKRTKHAASQAEQELLEYMETAGTSVLSSFSAVALFFMYSLQSKGTEAGGSVCTKSFEARSCTIMKRPNDSSGQWTSERYMENWHTYDSGSG